jgi:hypothetical protein
MVSQDPPFAEPPSDATQDEPTRWRERVVPGIDLLAEIGSGGFGTVYRAWQVSVGREVAVKLDQRRIETESVRQDFLREITAAGQVSAHPNIVSVFDGGITADGRPYIVMELCPAGSLWRTVSEHGAMTPEAVIEVGIQIADALAAAHQAGIVHRDVKPGNILITQFGKLALTDFGLASLPATWGVASMTQAALTPTYAPPEAFRGAKPSPAWDVYSLGATLYALLAAKPPRWTQDGPPSLEQLVHMSAEPLPHLPQPPPQPLWDAISWATFPDPAVRAPSAASLRDALIQARDLLTHRAPAVEAPPLLAAVPVPVFNQPDGRPRRRKLVAALVAAAVLVGLGGAGLAWALDRRDQVEDTAADVAQAGGTTAADPSAGEDQATPGSQSSATGPAVAGPSEAASATAQATETASPSPGPTASEDPVELGTCYHYGVVINGVPVEPPVAVPCPEEGGWEVYATGRLADDAPGNGTSSIIQDPSFFETCGAPTLYQYWADRAPDEGWSDDVGFQFMIWGPTDLQFTAGDRAYTCATFRCGGDRAACLSSTTDQFMWPDLQEYRS